MEPGPVSPAARALFDRLADLPREQWDGVLEVEHKSGMSPADIAAVRALLQGLSVSVRPEGTRAGAAMRGLRQRIEAATALAYPKQVGPYRILEQIGRGGYATVFRAEQEVPIRRTVAVKFLHPSHLIDDVVARFRLEQQALASLEHPNIARIIDAGQSELGIPYFVMEYVPGPPVTEYADRKKLTIRERLELFEQVCRGVLHAHQRGLIHRDLKPSNILVAEVDGRPIAKVIDFGIAKALAGEGRGAPTGEQAEQTLGDQGLGTLAYMSPEQAQARPDADVRTDVFGLGVVLYELLVGVTPLDPVQLQSAWDSGGPLSALGLVCQADSPRPSSRLRELRERGDERTPNSAAGRSTPTVADAVAADRGTTAEALQRLMQSELEWIPLKALEKERERRYETVGELAADIRRYLSDEPILARPASTWYQVRKFSKRNKGLVAGVGLALISLLGGVTATSIALWHAAAEATRARTAEADAIRQQTIASGTVALVTDDLLRAASPQGSLGPNAPVRTVLMEAVSSLRVRKFQEPEQESALYRAFANFTTQVGEEQLALELARHAVATSASANPGGVEHGLALAALTSCLSGAELLPEAEEAGEKACELLERYLDEKRPNPATCFAWAGASLTVHRAQYRQSQSQSLLKAMPEQIGAIIARCRRHGVAEADVLPIRMLHGEATFLAGRAREAEVELREVERDFGVIAPNHQFRWQTRILLADVLDRRGETEAAVAVYSDSVAVLREQVGPESLVLAEALTNFGTLLLKIDRCGDAIPRLQEAVAIRSTLANQLGGASAPKYLRDLVSVSENSLAVALWKLGRLDEAEASARKVDELWLSENSPGDWYRGNNRKVLARILIGKEQYPEAKRILEETRNAPKCAVDVGPEWALLPEQYRAP